MTLICVSSSVFSLLSFFNSISTFSLWSFGSSSVNFSSDCDADSFLLLGIEVSKALDNSCWNKYPEMFTTAETDRLYPVKSLHSSASILLSNSNSGSSLTFCAALVTALSSFAILSSISSLSLRKMHSYRSTASKSLMVTPPPPDNLLISLYITLHQKIVNSGNYHYKKFKTEQNLNGLKALRSFNPNKISGSQPLPIFLIP